MSRDIAHFFDTPYPDEVLIAIWPRSHDCISGAIRFFTRGRGTHASFIRGNGNVIENFWPCVREREFTRGEREQVEEYRIAGSTPSDWWNLERWFDEQLNKPRAPLWLAIAASIPFVEKLFRGRLKKYRTVYSIADLFRYAVNLKPIGENGGFCSMWVLRGCRKKLPLVKQPLVRLEYQDYASPRDLRISPLLIQRRK